METLTFTAYTARGTFISLANPMSMEIIKSFDTPADSLELELAHSESCPDLITIAVKSGKKLVFYGYVDEQIQTVAQTSTLLVRARSAGSLLVDNEALPQYYYMPTISDILRNHIEPYGFLHSVMSIDSKMSRFSVPKGLSEWEVLDLFCRRTMGHSPYVRDGVIYMRPFQGHNHWRVCNGHDNKSKPGDIPFISLARIRRRSAIISAYIIRGPSGVYDSMLDNPIVSRTEVRRKRYLVPPNEFVYNPLRDAYQRLHKSGLAYSSYKVVMPGTLGIGVGDYLYVDHAYMRTNGYFVAQVQHRYNAQGEVTIATIGDYRYLT